MPNTGASIHHVVFDARRQRFQGAVSIGGGSEMSVSVPGHPSWGYRRIAKAMISASQSCGAAVKGGGHDRD